MGFPGNGLYNVGVQVTYSITSPLAYTNSVAQTNVRFVQIVSVPTELELGRAYPGGHGADWAMTYYNPTTYREFNKMTPTGGSESRPKNAYVNYIIKY